MVKVSEHQEQVNVVTWFKVQHPKFKDYIMAIPNGAHLAGTPKVRAIKMGKMKHEGFLCGAADLFIMIPVNGWHGLFIEMKAKGGKVSENQQEFLGNAHLMGYFAVVCYGFEEAKNAISNYIGGKF